MSWVGLEKYANSWPPFASSLNEARSFTNKSPFTFFSEILREKKKTAKEFSAAINALKKEIDDSRELLESKKQERLQEGDFLTEQGQVVIEEEEYEYLRKVKDLKARYRKEFDELQNVKCEVSYCEKLVNQCRQRLLTEFDNWYSESFLGPDEQLNSLSVGGAVRKVVREGQIPEDEQEKFDRLQLELLMEHPDSVPYYNAKMQTERRIHLTASGQRRRKAGGLVATVKNQPPTTLTVT